MPSTTPEQPNEAANVAQRRAEQTARARLASQASFAVRRIERARQEIADAEAVIAKWKRAQQ